MDQTTTSINSFTTTDRELENNLKDLLERILIQVEKHIETKEELNQIESELKDYESLSHLVGIIKVIFTKMMLKIEKKIQQVKQIHAINRKLEKFNDPTQTRFSRDDDEYEKLEQTLIKYEQEIRKHISIEQQLKLYAESIQTKLDESEEIRQELLETTKNNISKLKRENQELHEKEQSLQQELVQLKQTIFQFEKESKRKQIEVNQREYLQNLIYKQANQSSNKCGNQKLFQEPRQSNSHSEHKLTGNHVMKESLETSDIVLPTQQPQKNNYYSILGNANKQKKSDMIKSLQQRDFNKIYGQIMRTKHNSLSSINDIMLSISQQERKRIEKVYSVSKNSSQNSSVIQRPKDHNEYQQRSRSSKRAEDTIKYKTLDSLIQLK
ncbi:unnamed protein product (macronuclear) [Paramecium tetraurelia]|uniref:Uncharacterized protein n=1 Tax=Paramecium tetraurelia TaxID=5888 RepID=A0E0T3_PARTE|nr:uncharacterized protein GSPATT00022068001 [Paramecium tetraurelia]CAK88900.1 unnamed protein product [Paramecium tetraurelia]|eukprot:XP_001456297.1 hypothetical protein (macronuclear) [Paramecium tetraurelia strain d4-2]